MIHSAKKLAGLGYQPVPLSPHYKPLEHWRTEKRYLERLLTEEEIEQDFEYAQNIGIACGELSKNFTCFDVDLKNDPDGTIVDEYDKALRENFPRYDELVIDVSRSGGRHYYALLEKAVVSKQLAFAPEKELSREIKQKDDTIKEVKYYQKEVILEIIGTKGLCFCSPSEKYEIIQGSLDNVPTITMGEFDLMCTLAMDLDKSGSVTEEQKETIVEAVLATNVEKKKAKKKEERAETEYTYDKTDPFQHYNKEGDAREFLEDMEYSYRGKNNDGYIMMLRDGSEEKKSCWIFPETNVVYVFSSSMSVESQKAYSLVDLRTAMTGTGLVELRRELIEEGFGKGHRQSRVEKSFSNGGQGGEHSKIPDEFTDLLEKKLDKEELIQYYRKTEDKIDWDAQLSKYCVDIMVKPSFPKCLLKGRDLDEECHYYGVFYSGETSAIVGKSGKGKGQVAKLIIAELLNPGCLETDNFFEVNIDPQRPIVIVDTEQPKHLVWKTYDQIRRLTGLSHEVIKGRLIIYNIQHMDMRIRESFFYKILERVNPQFILFDGIADIGNVSINDELAAKAILGRIRMATFLHNTHLCGIIHTSDKNPKSNEPMGWMGTTWKHRAEAVIIVSQGKDKFKTAHFDKARNGAPSDFYYNYDIIKDAPAFIKKGEVTTIAEKKVTAIAEFKEVGDKARYYYKKAFEQNGSGVLGSRKLADTVRTLFNEDNPELKRTITTSDLEANYFIEACKSHVLEKIDENKGIKYVLGSSA